MKGMNEIIATIVLLLVLVSLIGLAWVFLSNTFFGYTSKHINSPVGGSYCSGDSASMTIQNVGTDKINLVNPPATDFSKIGNMIPNPGFELDENRNNMPDFWEQNVSGVSTIDVVLVTDLSNSMSECMDQREAEPDMDTLLLYHFNDGTASDAAGRNGNGTLGSSPGSDPSDPQFTLQGRFGGAFVFNNAYINTTADLSWNKSANFSIGFWLSPDNITGQHAVMGKPGPDFEWKFGLTDGILDFCYWSTHSVCSISLNTGISKDVWTHIMLTYDPVNRAKLYKNGNLVAVDTTVESGYEFRDRDNAMFIGRSAYTNLGASRNFSGKIDEVVVYNRTLTENEVKSISLSMKGSLCPSDGRDDMPSSCRYETALCPPARPAAEESYAPQSYFAAPVFYNITYYKNTTGGGLIANESSCALYSSNSTGYCAGIGKIWNGTVRGATTCRSACLAGEFNDGDCYPAENCFLYNRTVGSTSVCSSLGIPYDRDDEIVYTVCRGLCLTEEYDAGYCSYSYINRTSCSTSVCESLGLTTIGPGNSIFTWRGSCISPNECNTGQTRYTSFRCAEGGCGGNEVGCNFCGSDCRGFETCCCRKDSLEYLCEQKTDNCTNSERKCQLIADKCCSVKNEQCRTIQQKCCDPVQAPACEIHIEALSVPCTPGVVGGLQPDPSQNCAWQECRAEGSCFLCDSVAIRLAKKLDREFVNSTFYSLELGIGIGLVSYGTSVQSSTEPQGPGGSGALYNEISGYNANKNETCMACAIGRAVQMVAPSGSDKKYIVLMSDGDANIRDNYAGTDRNGDGIVDAKDDAIARACDAYAQHGIVFYTIGFGSQGGESTLMQISNCSGSEGRYYHGETPEELADIYQNIARQISSARLDRSNTVYGSQSMKLDSTQEPPEASSDRFGIYAAPGEEYEISFYRKLDLTGGVLDFRMYFYNSSGGLAGEFLHEYSNATSDQAFQKDVFQVAVPNGSVEASIGFQFVNASGEIRVDDMYFGPPVACIKEADGYRCGDLLIRKVSNDGDFYPYFSKDGINPKSTVTIKDANCKGSCEYKIFTTSTVLTEDVNCNSGFQL